MNAEQLKAAAPRRPSQLMWAAGLPEGCYRPHPPSQFIVITQPGYLPILHTRTTDYGPCSFAVSGPRCWVGLPSALKTPSLSI